ncbi:MAG: 2-succinyl-5-enolpyruvyl-6-hydroxy-3-cyclohexene-1-carboxylic-acid synthase [Dermatophilaceae bacterium]
MDSSTAAVAVLRDLVAGGVREVVLSPGSRSAPLALALYAADAAGDLRLHVRVDERSAGYLALGLSMGSRRPVAVVTTSGTAVGNLLPAVMEAHHSGRRLVVVSADRPAALRGTGANQTTWQEGIFGRFAPCHDLGLDATAADLRAAVASVCRRRGPGHLNLQFAPPLVPDRAPWWPGPPADGPSGDPDGAGAGLDPGAGAARDPAVPERLDPGPATVVVAGDEAGRAGRLLAEAGGWPLLAEPTSGSRAGDHAIRTYRLLLRTPLADAVERVVVVGHPTLSRPVTALLSRPDVELLSVLGPGGIATDPARTARHLGAVPSVERRGDPAWLARWRAADTRLGADIDRLAGALPELDALHVAAEVGAALGPGETLVVGSSNPVRDLDLMLEPYPPRQRRMVVGNRGLAGIDGLVSTAVGVALGRGGERRTLALVGDLTFLHDANGLVLGPGEACPDLTVVVVNDDGGSIFALLEQGAQEYAAAFERVFATPHGVDLGARCAATGTAYRRVVSRRELRDALAQPSRGIRVLEARVSRERRRQTAAAITALTGAIA